MNVRALVEKLGGPTEVAVRLGETVKAVSMWGTRDRLPAAQHLAVWKLARERGVDWTPPGAEGLTLAPREGA